MLNADALYWAGKLRERLDAQRQIDENLAALARQCEMAIHNTLLFNAPMVVNQVMPQPTVHHQVNNPVSRNRNNSLNADDVLSFIEEFITAFRVSPTRKEIREGLQCSHSLVKRSLVQLCREGKLNIEYGKVRGITMTKHPRSQQMSLSYILNAEIETSSHETDNFVRRKLP